MGEGRLRERSARIRPKGGQGPKAPEAPFPHISTLIYLKTDKNRLNSLSVKITSVRFARG